MEFAFLQLTKQELLDIHEALLAKWIVEDSLREARGLETIDPPALLLRLEQLIGMNDDVAHARFHAIEDELWEYSWQAYTDEWAWFRAKQEVLKELGPRAKRMSDHQQEKHIEERYEKSFDRYVSEIDMQEEKTGKKKNRSTSRLPRK